MIATPLQEIDREYRTGETPDWRLHIIFLFMAFCLSLRYYFGKMGNLKYFFPSLAPGAPGAPGQSTPVLFDCLYFGISAFVIFLLLPWLLVKTLYREEKPAFGLSLRSLLSYKKIYVTLFLLMIPVLAVVSRFDSFLSMYPMCKLPRNEWSSLFLWEAVYGAQFLSVEFFFRGVLLYIAARYFGSSAIFIFMVPYVMFHFGKPFGETLASAVAAMILGTLSLYTRSIWGGFFVHAGVAWTMDFAAIASRGGFRIFS